MSSRFRIGLVVLLFALLAGSLSAIACGSSKKSATPTPGMTTAPAATATKASQATATKAPQVTGTAAATVAPTSTPGAAAKSASVTIKDLEFTPATVTIAVGGTVTWTNNGPSTHTVTADDGSFDSGNLSQGKTFSHTFQTAGTFAYHCSIHPFMTATVIVQQASSSSASPGY
jgi:plastocyanin